jgi:hypothetical protein
MRKVVESSKVPIDRVFLRRLLLKHKTFLLKIYSAHTAKDIKLMLETASRFQLNVLLRILYLIVHEGKQAI